MDRICSWCGALLAGSAALAPLTTHGICVSCLAELHSSLRRGPAAASGTGISPREVGAGDGSGK